MRLWQMIFFAAILAIVPAGSAEAKKPHHHKPVVPQLAPSLIPALPPLFTTYDVYVGGLHLVAAQVWFQEEAPTLSRHRQGADLWYMEQVFSVEYIS